MSETLFLRGIMAAVGEPLLISLHGFLNGAVDEPVDTFPGFFGVLLNNLLLALFNNEVDAVVIARVPGVFAGGTCLSTHGDPLLPFFIIIP